MGQQRIDFYKTIFPVVLKDMKNRQNMKDCYDLLLAYKDEIGFHDRENRDYAMNIAVYAHKMAAYMASQTGQGVYDDLYWAFLKIEAPYLVDAFFRYVERDDRPERRFYEPRAKTLKPIIDAYQEIADGDLDFLSVSQPKRTGKCLTVDEMICTPDGFKRIGDIRVGDYVTAADGKPTKVIGVYPQSEKLMVYEVEFSESGKSKQKTVIECCENHLWEVTVDGSEVKVLSTRELFESIDTRNYSVEYAGPVEFSERDVAMEPYAYGKTLNDAIPFDYLANSVDVRTKLLQGLLDTDGHCENGGIEYCTASKCLADDVLFLVKSLGGKASLDKQENKYRIYINFPRNGICPVTSQKHLLKYKPQREKLYHYINGIRETNRYAEMVCIEVEDARSLYVVSPNFIPTHNTQSALRLSLMLSGRRPDRSMLAVGSGQQLVSSFYQGMLTIIDRPVGQPNRFFEIFPDAMLGNAGFASKADDLTIDLQSPKTFKTITCRSIDGKIVGCTEASNLLYLDDTVANHEEATNRRRLEFLCEKVSGDVLGRRIEGTPILIQGTKYSLYDPITFLQNKAREMGWRWKEIALPALDPVTDESNFTIFIDGRWRFTTEFYRSERKLVTDEVWAAEFQQQPYEVRGRMFPEINLHTYVQLPVDMDPDTIVAACDTAESGEDCVAMPIAYVYGTEVYIEDVVFSSASPDHTIPMCANMLVKHGVSAAVFESNNAGTYFARDVANMVKQLGGICDIRTKRTITNKITRMENASVNIIEHFWFKDKTKYEPNSEYGQFFRQVVTVTRTGGKRQHDDAPDSLSILENELRQLVYKRKTRIIDGIL